MKIDILIDSKEFFEYLKSDIRKAKRNIYIQAMTFEADNAGKRLCELLMNSSATDIRILIDSYIKVMMSDCFLYSLRNVFNLPLRNEFKETFKLINQLNDLGVKVKLTNPLGPLLIRYPSRNHKKLITIDNKISYVGGFNISDHNFLWHDMMLRIEGQNFASFLEKDFLMAWIGKKQCCKESFESSEVYIFDGKSNEALLKSIFELIEQAKQTIFIESAYLSFPFYSKLRQASKRGVNIILVTPEKNNKPAVQKYTCWESRRSNLELQLFKKNMTHLKAMLIDDKFLIVGSSNFDYFSYTTQQELILIIYDLDIINKFKRQVIQEDLNNSVPWLGRTSNVVGFLKYLISRTILLFWVKLSRLYDVLSSQKSA